MSFRIIPDALINLAIGIYHFSKAFAIILYILALKDIAIFVVPDSFSMPIIIVKLSQIPISLRINHLSIAFLLVVDKVSLISAL
jgi:hypothetical protein